MCSYMGKALLTDHQGRCWRPRWHGAGLFPCQDSAGPFATHTSPDSPSMPSAQGRKVGTLGRQARPGRHQAGAALTWIMAGGANAPPAMISTVMNPPDGPGSGADRVGDPGERGERLGLAERE